MGNKKEEAYSTGTTIIIILMVIIWALLDARTNPIPDNCHLTPSVDVGGSDLECD